MKLLESYCRGQVGLYQETREDGTIAYYVQTCGSAFIPVKTLASGRALCEAFVQHTL